MNLMIRVRHSVARTTTAVLIASSLLGISVVSAGGHVSGAWPAPVVECVAGRLGKAVATELDNGLRQPSASELVVIAACFSASSGGSSNSGSSNSGSSSNTTPSTSPTKTTLQLKCTKLGLTKTVNGVKLTCTKSGKKLIWSTGAGGSSKATGSCPSLDQLIAGIVGPPEVQKYQSPTAADIACNAKSAKRISPVKGLVQMSDAELEDRPDYAPDNQQGGFRKILQMRDENLFGFTSALSNNSQQNMVPPHDFVHPIPLNRFEEVARVYSAVLLKEKSLGRAVLFNVSESPDGVATFPMKPTSTVAEHKLWLKDYWIPRVKILANAAELIKAEYFDPFIPEADIVFNLSFSSLSGTERVALAQEFIDATRNAASSFKGVLIGRQGWQFEAATEGMRNLFAKTPMADLSWKGFGILGVSLLPVMLESPCTKEYVRSYMQKQLAVITQMAERDGIPWAILELDVFTFGSLSKYSACANPLAVYSELWQVIIDELNSVALAPRLVTVGLPSEWTSNAAVIKELTRVFATYKQR